MGRNQKNYYCDSESKVFFARWYDNTGKKCRASLNTKDEPVALQRLTIVLQAKCSWNDYQKSIGSLNAIVINQMGASKFIPGMNLQMQPAELSVLVQQVVAAGQAYYEPSRGFYVLNNLNGTPTDSTVLQAPPGMTFQGQDVLTGLDTIRKSAYIDQWTDIESFYTVTMKQVFTDEGRVRRMANLFLGFLRQEKIVCWAQINEPLMIRYKTWRMSYPVPRGKNSKVAGKPCSMEMLNRDIAYLTKSFASAINRGYMKTNPIMDWKDEYHVTPSKTPLTIDELKHVFKALPAIIRDIVILLFVSCKRRKEVCELKITDVNFEAHYVSYIEFKNKTRSNNINKSFWITPAMEVFLKRVIGDRTTGSLWPETFHPDTISHAFSEASQAVAPTKEATLKNLRQTATSTMELAGLTDLDIDITLGHISVSKALGNYKDKTPDWVYRRLAERTRPGVEALSKSLEDFLINNLTTGE